MIRHHRALNAATVSLSWFNPRLGKILMINEPGQERRQESRYEIRSREPIVVQVHRTSGENTETIQGELIDLSRSGAKIALPACLQFDEVMFLHITVEELGLHIEVTGKVCWIRPVDEQTWHVGYTLSPKVSDELIEQFAVGGIIERRQHSRHEADLQAMARCELDEETFPVRIRDYSADGFCITGCRSGNVGQAIRLIIDKSGKGSFFVSGRVVWKLQRSDDYLIGCTFSSSKDFESLLEAIGALRERQHAALQRVRIRSRRLLLVAGTLLVLVLAGTHSGFTVSLLPEVQLSQPPSRAQRKPKLSANVSSAEITKTSLTHVEHKPTHIKPAPVETESKPKHQHPHDTTIPYDGEPAHASHSSTRVDSAIPDLDAEPRPNNIDETLRNGLAELGRALWPPQVESEPSLRGINVNADRPAPPDIAADTKTNDETPPAQTDDVQADAPIIETREQAIENTHRTTNPTDSVNPPATGQRQAISAFAQGSRFYRIGRYEKAIRAFQSATKHDPQNAFYYYLLAMSQYQSHDEKSAERNLKIGISLEKKQPIENWGAKLSRYQGRPRLWVEQRRSTARIGVSR